VKALFLPQQFTHLQIDRYIETFGAKAKLLYLIWIDMGKALGR